MQQGQVFELKKRAVDGSPVWAYRYRTDGPASNYGHLARDGREHAIRLLDCYADINTADVQPMDVRWTPKLPIVARYDNGNSA